MATRAPAPAGDDDFALLQRFCLKCGYDLRGLPEDDRCPECGEDVAHGIWRIPLDLRPFKLFNAVIFGVPGVAVLVLPLFSPTANLPPSFRTLWLGFVAVLIGAAVGPTFNVPPLHWFMPISIRMDDDVVSYLFHNRRWLPIAWREIHVVRIRRIARTTWHIRLRVRMFSWRVGTSTISGFVRGTPRQVARLRAELRRRVKAAKQRPRNSAAFAQDMP